MVVVQDYLVSLRETMTLTTYSKCVFEVAFADFKVKECMEQDGKNLRGCVENAIDVCGWVLKYHEGARSACLCLLMIKKYGESAFFQQIPKEIVKEMALYLWSSRNDDMWVKEDMKDNP